MNRLRRYAAALGRFFGIGQTERQERDLEDELRFHIEMQTEENLRRGMAPEEARRQAVLLFGGVEGHKEASRDLRPGRALDDLARDFRYGARALRKQPGFTAAAVLTLALGIGATTAIFSVVRGVLLKPLPFDEPDALVSLRHHAPHGVGTVHGPANFLTYRESQQAFEAIGAWNPSAASITAAGSNPERVEALEVSAATLPLLRVRPVMGRVFSAEDDTPGNPLRVVLTHGYWQRRFGGATNIIGQTLTIDGRPAEVIGVLPRSFSFLRTHPAILLPMPLDPGWPRDNIGFGFQALARLKPGVTLAQANADVARLIALLPPGFAQLELRPDVRPLAVDVIGNVGEILWILMAAVGVVLLIACGNVANLFLVRAEGRQQELVIRAALGASRGRIRRALLTESVLLALAGGVVGVTLAWVSIGLLRTLAPTELPRVNEIGIDLTVLIFTLVVSMLSGALFGLVATVDVGSPVIAALKDGGRSTTDAPARHRTRSALVVGQIALALTLLIVSGLLVRTVVALRKVDPGFIRPEEIQTFAIAIPSSLISDAPLAARTFENVAERLTQVPGVASVGLSSSITMDGENNGNSLEVEGFPRPEDGTTPLRRFKSFGPGYFETMGIPLIAGRSLTWREIHEQRPVIVISEPIAREIWGDPAKALGSRVRVCCGWDTEWREIVGVTGSERDDGLARPPTPIVYWPLLNERYEWRTMVYAVRSSRVGAPGFVRELEQAVWAVNPDLPLARVQTVEEIQAQAMAQTSFAMVMLSIAASVALLIGVVGIYGVIAYAVVRRSREIGIRMALGAQVTDVRRVFLRQALWLTAAGILIGIGVAMAVTRVMSAFLFGVGPIDPVTYAAVSAVLAVAVLVGTYLPARRATRVDPLVALRSE